jgi:hypothetical protein
MLDSECANHMTGEKEMLTPFKENDCSRDTIIFGDNSEGYLGMVKLLSPPIILFLRFYLLILWIIICCLYHNIMRWDTIIFHK